MATVPCEVLPYCPGPGRAATVPGAAGRPLAAHQGAHGRRFWLRHAVLPGAAFAALAWAGARTGLDLALARAWAFDAAAGRFIGTGPGDWWARGLLHTGGGAAIRAAGVALLIIWLLARLRPALMPWRRAAAYALTAVVVGATLVGLLKATSNVDCPRVLEPFGGARPYVHLFADRPDALPQANCFPGGHSSSGFALFALYFALRDRHRRVARWALGLALAVGMVFAFGQEARGAHFLSHDVWSAAIMWFTGLALYAGPYRGRLWSDAPRRQAGERTMAG